MSPPAPTSQDASNQVAPLADDNPFAADIALQDAVAREGAADARRSEVLHERFRCQILRREIARQPFSIAGRPTS